MGQQYEEKFKKEIVFKHVNDGIPVSTITKEFGLNASVVYKWIKLYSVVGITDEGEAISRDEILKLKKENMRLQEEVEILKKATAIFANQKK